MTPSDVIVLITEIGGGRYSAEVEDIPGTYQEFDSEQDADDAAPVLAQFFMQPTVKA